MAFSPDERSMLAALPPELRQEWALRMWCAKEAVGKALGRGLSAGLLAFHITRVAAAGGGIEVELRDGALEQCPQLRGKSLNVYTARESNFVFSAIIYQQGAVRMRPSRQEILDYLLQKMGELTQDWDYPDPVRPESLLFTELGFESLDAVVLCTAIQEHYQTPMPFAELLAEIGQQQRDLSIDELTDFVDTHLWRPGRGRPQGGSNEYPHAAHRSGRRHFLRPRSAHGPGRHALPEVVLRGRRARRIAHHRAPADTPGLDFAR